MELKNSLLPLPRIQVQVAHIELLFGIILNYQVQYLMSQIWKIGDCSVFLHIKNEVIMRIIEISNIC